MAGSFVIGEKMELSLEDLIGILDGGRTLELSSQAIENIEKGRIFLEKEIRDRSVPIYGINTGFGSLYKKKIPSDHLAELQENLVRSHACGMGPEVPARISQWIMLLKLISLSKGYSGVTKALIDTGIEYYNKSVFPVIFEMGSLGASGDLAPLAHLALSLIGEGESWLNEEKRNTEDVISELDLQPHKLVEKEGLAILNGTQFMQAYMGECLSKGFNLLNWACIVGAISLDAFKCRYDAFHPDIQRIRNQDGQKTIAKVFLELLNGSELGEVEKTQIQDPYSFRCIPQVLGASVDSLNYILSVFEKEINGVTDNPNIIPESNLIISGGNFHGQPLALALDFLTMALAEIGNISERRIFQMLGGKRELPEFLTQDPGLNSGLMIPQYTAASLVSFNKQLCTPSSVDSISSSNGQEDHVSMGANAGLKTFRVLKNLEEIIAIELFTASQAMSFRDQKTSPFLEEIVKEYREVVPILERDRNLHEDLKKTVNYIRTTKKEIGF